MLVEIIRKSYVYRSHPKANAYRSVGYWVLVNGRVVVDGTHNRESIGFEKRHAEMIKRNIEKNIWSYGRDKKGLAISLK